jgi:hypothetical protein
VRGGAAALGVELDVENLRRGLTAAQVAPDRGRVSWRSNPTWQSKPSQTVKTGLGGQ